jgi:hypothetical protein
MPTHPVSLYEREKLIREEIEVLQDRINQARQEITTLFTWLDERIAKLRLYDNRAVKNCVDCFKPVHPKSERCRHCEPAHRTRRIA